MKKKPVLIISAFLISFVLLFFLWLYFKPFTLYFSSSQKKPIVCLKGSNCTLERWSPSDGTPKPPWVPDESKKSSESSQSTESSPFASLSSSLSSDLAKWRQFRLATLPTYEWDNWDWQTGYVFFDIVSVDKPNKKLSVYTVQPIDQVFPDSSFETPATVSTNCPQESSAITDPSMENYTKTNINIFDADISDTNRYSLWTQCLNEQCSLVGNICILVPVTVPGGQ